jgi:WD40 repeat protein
MRRFFFSSTEVSSSFQVQSAGPRRVLVAMLLAVSICGGCSRSGPDSKRAVLKGHAQAVTALAFAPDGGTLATGGEDMTVRLWDTATGQAKGNPLDHFGRVNAVTFAPHGKTLATGSGYPSPGTVVLRDPSTGKEQGRFDGLKQVYSLAFSPDGRILAGATGEGLYSALMTPGGVKLWDVDSRTERATLRGHAGIVTSVAFAPDGQTLATGSEDRTVKLWDVATWQERASLKFPGMVKSIAFSPDGQRLAVAGSGGKEVSAMAIFRGGVAKVYDGATLQELVDLKGHTHFVFSVAFAPDGKVLATASGTPEAGELKLWDAATGKELASPKCHTGEIKAVAFAPDGKTLATASDDRTVTLWDTATILESKPRE